MQLGFNPKQLRFLDEIGAKTNLTRLYGRAPIGQRLVDRTPQSHWINVTHIGCLTWSGMIASHAFVGSMTKILFLDYLRQHLLPLLRKGDIVVMDNLAAHKGKDVEELVASVGAKVLYLPAYSPDLNPIELSYSKLKSVLRKKKIRDVAKLKRFLKGSTKLFAPEECKNYFKHDGYKVK
jgi:transposase